ncbi:Mu transposase C-terminal domain-containing protein [Mycolicibacterium austroafricanum]|uniref:Mu transposase C-terminal domain-containing protein n=1 Tax=Mycolicibacterium austroafricanum TaxID=39687 RepID=A0ABT8H8V0_MYCAO|nr:Mu transposase C-terminal domain-containing protein [Mycolicibacterium austroafricanum]MDN4517183.1 Mu transposase C-terminal domain-containing protein [Mycolicibacterium austroafricanum]
MRSVRLFDFIEYDACSWQVVAQDGPLLALKNLSSNRIRRVSVSALLNDESYLPDPLTRLPGLDDAAVLDTLGAQARAETCFRHRHVIEVLTGVPPLDDGGAAPGRPNPDYDPRNRLGDRIEAKLAELAALGRALSARTFRRYLAAYRREGIGGLVDRRRTRGRSPTGRVDQRVVALLETAAAEQLHRSTGTRSRVINTVSLRAALEGLPVPSRATMYRAVAAITRGLHTFGNATTRRTQANRPDRSWGRQAPDRPGELVEIDSTPLDVMVLNPDGSVGRAELTAAVDIATRTVLAAILRPVATSVDAAVLLARALTPTPIQPGWLASVGFSRHLLPPGMIADTDTLSAQLDAKPVIVPETITVDRGKAFTGATFVAACEKLQISVIVAAPRTPTDKPHIERAFAAINSGFTQYLAGYAGANVVRRGRDPATEALWSLADVQNLLDIWIATVWQNRPHKGLRHPAMPRKDLTPNEAFAALAGVAPQTNLTLTADDYIELLPVAYRSIQPYGINFADLHYDSPDLHEYRNTVSGLPEPAAGRWEIRYDPHRLTTIFVRDHHRRRWIHADWTLAKHALAPFSLDTLRAAKAAVADRGAPNTAAQYLAELTRIQTGLHRTRREHRVHNRTTQTPATIPAAPPPAASPPADPTPPRRRRRPTVPTLAVTAARRIDED